MSNIKCVIVDDEPTARDILQILISQIEGIDIIFSCKNASEALSVLNENNIDLLFLDINMPGMSGITLAKSISKKTKIIFTTAYREYAIDGFDLQAVDYLLKPISLRRMQQAIEKYKSENNRSQQNTISSKEYIIIRSERKMVKINLSEILYVESLSDYLKVYTETKMIITRETITNIDAKLPSNSFIRIHRSYIVSINYINSYTSEFVEINEKAIPISRSYRSSFLMKMETE